MSDRSLKKRLDYIDIAKSLGMLTIIWGHIATGRTVTFVYTFHIPLFFVLSGMVFVRDKYPDFGSFVKRRLQTLILPYIIYSFITWAIWAVFSYFTHAKVISYWMPLLETFVAQGSEGYLVHNVPLWFVSCLFVIELLYYWISQLTDLWNIIICLLCAVLSYVLVNYCTIFDFTTLPWSIEVAMAAIIFYAIGNLLIKHIGHQQFEYVVNKKRWASIFIVILLFVIVWYAGLYNKSISMGHANLRNPFIFYAVACAGVLAFLMLSSLVAQSNINSQKWMSGVKWFGQNSFIAMAIHNPIKGFVIVALASVLGMQKMEIMSGTWTALLALFVTVAVTTLLMLFIVKVKEKRNNKL